MDFVTLGKAIKLAQKAHHGQYRNGNSVPYIFHPLSVMLTLLKHGASFDAVVAGVLHDVVEDNSQYTLPQIEEMFGARVAKLVEVMTDEKFVGLDKKSTWKIRKQHKIDLIAGISEIEYLLLICADKLNNLKDSIKNYKKLGDVFFEEFNEGKVGQIWYHVSLGEAFDKVGKNLPIVEEYKKALEIFKNLVSDTFSQKESVNVAVQNYQAAHSNYLTPQVMELVR